MKAKLRFWLFVFRRWCFWTPRQLVSRAVTLYHQYCYHSDMAWFAEMHYEGTLSFSTRIWVKWRSLCLALEDVRRAD